MSLKVMVSRLSGTCRAASSSIRSCQADEIAFSVLATVISVDTDHARAVIDAGATTINVPDTVGYNVPSQFGETLRQLIERVPNADKAVFSVHCHNDLGLAVANSLSAVMNGARQVECTINGIGERAGNCSLEEVVIENSF